MTTTNKLSPQETYPDGDGKITVTCESESVPAISENDVRVVWRKGVLINNNFSARLPAYSLSLKIEDIVKDLDKESILDLTMNDILQYFRSKRDPKVEYDFYTNVSINGNGPMGARNIL